MGGLENILFVIFKLYFIFLELETSRTILFFILKMFICRSEVYYLLGWNQDRKGGSGYTFG